MNNSDELKDHCNELSNLAFSGIEKIMKNDDKLKEHCRNLSNLVPLSIEKITKKDTMWMDFIKKLFKKKKLPEVIVGQIYILKADKGNPFNDYLIRILNVKNGFVQYSVAHKNALPMSYHIKGFLNLYELYKDINHSDSFL